MAHGNHRHITISTRPQLFLGYNEDLTLNLPLETSETVMLERMHASRQPDYSGPCLNTHVAT